MRQIITERGTRRRTTAELATQRDSGHSGIEMIATLAVVGVLGSAVALMITGMSTQAAGNTCDAGHRALSTAVTTYFMLEGAATLPEVGPGADRFELALVDAGYLQAASDDFDLTATGAVVTSEMSSC